MKPFKERIKDSILKRNWLELDDCVNKNYITTLFDKAIHYVLTKYYNINFSKINLKQYQQNMFKNKGDKDRGICGLVALFSAFGKYFKNNSMKTIDNLTKLPVNIRNNMHNLVSYLNQYELQEDYSLIISHMSNDYNKLKSFINFNISNNLPICLCLIDNFLKGNNEQIGHAVAICGIDNNDYVYFIENAGNTCKRSCLIDIIAAFWIPYMAYTNSDDDFKIPNITMAQLFDEYDYLIDKFYEKFVSRKTHIFGISLDKLLFPFEINYNRTSIISLNKTIDKNMSVFKKLELLKNPMCFNYLEQDMLLN